MTACKKDADSTSGSLLPVVNSEGPRMVAPVNGPFEPHTLTAGTRIPVKLLEILDSGDPMLAPFTSAEVGEDVQGSKGERAIPAGSTALVRLRRADRIGDVSTLTVTLYSISVGGHQIRFTDNVHDKAAVTFTENAKEGPAHRTVHLSNDTMLDFKLDAPVDLK